MTAGRGAGEQTIIARVGEGIVTTVGSSVSYKEVLENLILYQNRPEKGLDAVLLLKFYPLILQTLT